jgi:hypothetical protein
VTESGKAFFEAYTGTGKMNELALGNIDVDSDEFLDSLGFDEKAL